MHLLLIRSSDILYVIMILKLLTLFHFHQEPTQDIDNCINVCFQAQNDYPGKNIIRKFILVLEYIY